MQYCRDVQSTVKMRRSEIREWYMSWGSMESFTKTGRVKKNSTLANVKLGMKVLLKVDFTCHN